MMAGGTCGSDAPMGKFQKFVELQACSHGVTYLTIALQTYLMAFSYHCLVCPPLSIYQRACSVLLLHGKTEVWQAMPSA